MNRLHVSYSQIIHIFKLKRTSYKCLKLANTHDSNASSVINHSGLKLVLCFMLLN